MVPRVWGDWRGDTYGNVLGSLPVVLIVADVAEMNRIKAPPSHHRKPAATDAGMKK